MQYVINVCNYCLTPALAILFGGLCYGINLPGGSTVQWGAG